MIKTDLPPPHARHEVSRLPKIMLRATPKVFRSADLSARAAPFTRPSALPRRELNAFSSRRALARPAARQPESCWCPLLASALHQVGASSPEAGWRLVPVILTRALPWLWSSSPPPSLTHRLSIQLADTYAKRSSTTNTPEPLVLKAICSKPAPPPVIAWSSAASRTIIWPPADRSRASIVDVSATF